MSETREAHAVQPEWVHVKYPEAAEFREVYGSGSGHGMVNVEGILLKPGGRPCKTLAVYMHPSSTLHFQPMPRALAARGMHVLCAASRYARNDSALIMEKVLLDLGAHVRAAREQWGYDKVVLVGWSGGGALSLFYQSQAEHPILTHTPAGDAVDLQGAGLIAADAMIIPAAHLSRAVLLADWIDPSVRDENDPDNRDPELDLYHPGNPHRPPYSAEYLNRYRAAQLDRVRRRTAWVKEALHGLRKRGGLEVERGFTTHRTMAEPRFIDATIEPNGRKPGTCYLGHPETVNNGPAGLARFSTLRSWLSQWSIDDSNADGEKCARQISAPLLVMENSADDAVPQPHTRRLYDAAGSKDKTFRVIDQANHQYMGQPEILGEAIDVCIDWMRERRLFD